MITTSLKSLIRYIIVCFVYNKDYSLTDLLRHASRTVGNSRETIKDIAKHYGLIMYIQRYLNVKVNETFSIITNDTTEINDASVVGNNRIIKDSGFSDTGLMWIGTDVSFGVWTSLE